MEAAPTAVSEAPLTFETAASPLAQAQQRQPTIGDGRGAAGAAATSPDGPGTSQPRFPDLSTVGPLQLSFVSLLPTPAGALRPGERASSSSSSSGGSSSSSISLLFEVVAGRSTPSNSSGWCSVPGWPMR